MQGREFSEQFIRQVCTDVLRGKSPESFSNYKNKTKFLVEIIKDISKIKKKIKNIYNPLSVFLD